MKIRSHLNACDTYACRCIKNAERLLRGDSETEEFVIRNPDIRIPANFARFLCNGKNKERLFEIIGPQFTTTHKDTCYKDIKSSEFFVSNSS